MTNLTILLNYIRGSIRIQPDFRNILRLKNLKHFIIRLNIKHYPEIPNSGDGPWTDNDARSDDLHKISHQFEIERVGWM